MSEKGGGCTFLTGDKSGYVYLLGTNEIPHLNLSERNEISDKHVLMLFFQSRLFNDCVIYEKMNDVFFVVGNSFGGVGLMSLRGQYWENPFC